MVDGESPVENGDSAPARVVSLPALEGRRGRIALVVYAITAFLVLVVIGGSFWFNARDYFGNIATAAEYGFRTRTADGTPEIASVARRADSARLREEDRILSIDGSALPVSATEFTIGDRLAQDDDGRIVLVTRSTDGSIREHRLARTPVSSATVEPGTGLPLWAFIAIGFGSTQLPLLIWFGASLLLAWRRPRDPEAMLFAFAFLCVCVSRGSAFWLHALVRIPNFWFDIVANVGGTLMFAAIAAFPDGRFPSVMSRFALAALALAMTLILAVPLAGAPSLLLDATAVIAILAVLGAVWMRYRRAADQRERQQIKWAVFGFCSALLIFLPTLLANNAGIVPEDGPWPFLLNSLVIPFALLLIPLGLLISLLRYRLYDADAAISRSAGYAVLTVLMAATFAAVAKGLELFFEASLGRDAGALPGVIGAGFAVALITPLNNRIQAWAERRFQKVLAHLRRDLPECMNDLRETASLGELVDEMLERIAVGVRADHAALIIGDTLAGTRHIDAEAVRKWLEHDAPPERAVALDCNRADPMFPIRLPLRVRHGSSPPVGWVLLGPRPDGSFYGKDERDALEEIADPAARALQIVLVREEREARQAARFAAIERKLARALEVVGDNQPSGKRATTS